MIQRTKDDLNLRYYGYVNPKPEYISKVYLSLPKEEQHILRMLISIDCGQTIFLPEEFDCYRRIICDAYKHQSLIGSSNPFVYLTIRHGIVKSVTDDLWHVDGFSLRIPHRPEQNYVWCDHSPTEFWDENISIPQDFDGKKHNLNYFFQDSIGNSTEHIKTIEPQSIYCFDPYVIHRRPKLEKVQRTFIRVSFTPIPIIDKNNTENPIFGFNFKTERDGIVGFRDLLKRYNT